MRLRCLNYLFVNPTINKVCCCHFKSKNLMSHYATHQHIWCPTIPMQVGENKLCYWAPIEKVSRRLNIGDMMRIMVCICCLSTGCNKYVMISKMVSKDKHEYGSSGLVLISFNSIIIQSDGLFQDVLSLEVKPILWSDEEELVSRHPEDQRKLVVKKFSETFVKNAFY